ncbi:lipoic acid synthetase [Hydrogenispora ethanolica]|uniref:Lipoyl synthase n=1 Tax=Hydrogenispora ethanolica TaxID=1082276 RepID=A0A4R1R8W5_HYDET|nr:lipoyl synthase [Hydrogenispora ethanolica]TCL62009.1 lipoic acid synthetase [Hydrogenispora ethanolica]
MRNRLPEWLRGHSPLRAATNPVREVLGDLHLNTVCLSAQCPNRGQCYGEGTATFLILGNVCTRRCRFCAVAKGEVRAVDPGEPARIVTAGRRLGLRHMVITSVTRDDLSDGGAGWFAAVVRLIRQELPGVTVEVLTPDFQGMPEAIGTVAAAAPDIFNHNLETVARLYPAVRPQADYRRSLELLRQVKRIDPQILTKSGLMVGLGESGAEVERAMDDLREAGCDFLTIGQYLQPTREHLPVAEYVRPEVFEAWAETAYGKGFRYVAAGPLVRSSFHAGAFRQLAR